MAPQPPPTHTTKRRTARWTRSPEVAARERNSAPQESSASTAPSHARSHRRHVHCARIGAQLSRGTHRSVDVAAGFRCRRRFGRIGRCACRRQHHLGHLSLTSHAVFAIPPLRRPGPRCRLHGDGLKLARLQRRVLVQPNRRVPCAFQASAPIAAWRGSRRCQALPTLGAAGGPLHHGRQSACSAPPVEGFQGSASARNA